MCRRMIKKKKKKFLSNDKIEIKQNIYSFIESVFISR